MKRNDYRNDSWASLASELGIDDPNASIKIDEEQIPAEPEVLSGLPFNTQEESLTTVAVIVEEAVKTSLRTETLRSESDFFGKGLLDDQPEILPTDSLPTNSLVAPEETPVPPKPREGKKNFFDRFPKINLFGTSTKESLAAVVESVKAPSLSGKSFTSSKLEKVPVSQERVARREKDHKSAELEETTPIAVPANAVETAPITSEQKAAVVNLLDPWSKIASQVGSLGTTPQQPDLKPVEAKKSWGRPLDNAQESNDDVKSHRRGRTQRTMPSMFDEQAPESEEAAALMSLIGADHGNTDEAERRLRSLFEEEIKPTIESNEYEPKPFNNRQDQESKYIPGRRGESQENRFKDRRPEGRDNVRENPRENIREKAFAANLDDDFDDEVKDRNADRRELSSNRERGRRGSRYEQREGSRFPKTSEELNRSEVGETTWDIEEDSKPVERSSRGRRRRERSDQPFTETERRPAPAVEKDIFETEVSSEEDFGFAQPHKNIPSWDDAINLLIENNIARHAQQGTGSRNNKGRR